MFSREHVVAVLCGVLLSFTLGCEKAPPPPEGVIAIEQIATWYQLYKNRNRKPPANEEAFIKFVAQELKSRGTELDADKFLTSPRDGERYVVNYGKPTSKNWEKNIAVQEAKGYDGKKLIAFEAGYAKEVDEAELESLLTAE